MAEKEYYSKKNKIVATLKESAQDVTVKELRL